MNTTLTTLKDEELIRLVKEDTSSDAFEEVCRRYENIFYNICQRYSQVLSQNGINPNDIYEDKNFIIFNCIMNFKPSKGTKLGTMIGNYARYLCLNTVNSRKYVFQATDEMLKEHIEGSQVAQTYSITQRENDRNEDVKYVINLLPQLKDKRIVRIFQLRYLNGKRMIWSDIARALQVSTQTVINLHNRGLSILRHKLNSKTISDII